MDNIGKLLTYIDSAIGLIRPKELAEYLMDWDEEVTRAMAEADLKMHGRDFAKKYVKYMDDILADDSLLAVMRPQIRAKEEQIFEILENSNFHDLNTYLSMRRYFSEERRDWYKKYLKKWGGVRTSPFLPEDFKLINA